MERPIIAGGQGRTSNELRQTAGNLAAVWIIAAAVAGLFLSYTAASKLLEML